MKLQPPPRAPEQEQKLIVLQCLRRFGPCTELQLLQFLAEHDVMNYFDMMFALNELCAQGQAARRKARAGYRYELTEAGQEALELFGGRAPRSVMTLLDEKGDAWRARFQREAQSHAKLRQTDTGEYETELEVTEGDTPLMALKLTLPTRELAAGIAEKWPDRAAEIYDSVIRLLSEDAK